MVYSRKRVDLRRSFELHLKSKTKGCGDWRDQYHIHCGTRILSKRLTAAGIEHRYEEFHDTRSGVDYRMDRSLPFLSRVLT